MEMLFSVLLELVLTVISIIASKYLIPWLKEKRLLSAAQIAVEAAEQMILESGAGKEKYNLALSWLAEKFKISEDQAKQLIESAVYKMNSKKE